MCPPSAGVVGQGKSGNGGEILGSDPCDAEVEFDFASPGSAFDALRSPLKDSGAGTWMRERADDAD